VEKECGIKAVFCDVWGKGGAGATELADSVAALCGAKNNFRFAYDDTDDIKTKIYKIATKIYGAKDVVYTEKAEESLSLLNGLGCAKMPVVIAKTQYSFSDDPSKLGAPKDFTLTVRDAEPRMGAGFVVALAGNMLLMPGLSKAPAYMNMDVVEGKIVGLF
jgi:formate--tetrahydrofolate ligase